MISIKYKRFKSPSNEPIRVLSPDGMVISWVFPEWIELREEVWADAYSKGCISDDMNRVGMNPLEAIANMKAHEIAYEAQVKKAIEEILDTGDPADFDGLGKPKLTSISAIVGTQPTAAQRDKAFKLIKDERK